MEQELEAQIQEQTAALADIDEALALEASDELLQARSPAPPIGSTANRLPQPPPHHPHPTPNPWTPCR